MSAFAVGDSVYWNDPDEGFSSGKYRVHRVGVDPGEPIEPDTIYYIINEAGSEAEVPFSELESPGASKKRVACAITLAALRNFQEIVESEGTDSEVQHWSAHIPELSAHDMNTLEMRLHGDDLIDEVIKELIESNA